MKNFMNRTIVALTLLSAALFNLGCGDSGQQNKEASKPKDFVWTTSSDEALADFEQGLDLLDAGETTLARESFTSAIEKDPNFAIAYALRSYTSGSGKEFAEDNNKALSLIDNCLRLREDNH